MANYMRKQMITMICHYVAKYCQLPLVIYPLKKLFGAVGFHDKVYNQKVTITTIDVPNSHWLVDQ